METGNMRAFDVMKRHNDECSLLWLAPHVLNLNKNERVTVKPPRVSLSCQSHHILTSSVISLLNRRTVTWNLFLKLYLLTSVDGETLIRPRGSEHYKS